MPRTERTIDASPEKIWDVLADGWLYPLWVVGASRMREVDTGWPQPGTRLHHSFGTWPLLIDDTTESLDADPARSLTLQARGWPAGAARVHLGLTPTGDEDGVPRTRVSIEEDVVSGPGRLVPLPARAAGIVWRNREALRRLAFLAERRG